MTMRYENITKGIFLDRPNRFLAHVESGGRTETVHVKNTGRCRELLTPGAEVYLTQPGTPGRKTRYDLVAVRKQNGILFNIDSQAPNKAVSEWLSDQQFDRIIPEYTYGSSRIDFYMEKGNDRYLMEVKGCTLFRDGVGLFPDAPTKRGAKHLRELAHALDDGYKTIIAFVIQGEGISEVQPNRETDPEFAEAFDEAKAAGVEVLFLKCKVTEDSISIIWSLW